MYLIAVLLPFASGTGAAAKGTILQMCSPGEKTDALSAITLIEMTARLATSEFLSILRGNVEADVLMQRVFSGLFLRPLRRWDRRIWCLLVML